VEGIAVHGLIPPGHKIATHAIAAGEPVRRYNQIIGFASKPIAAGEHVHTHNLDVGPNGGDFARDYAFGADVKPEPARREATFLGIKRPAGRVATRNYIGILSSVNCSATAARAIADHFSRQTNPQALAAYPNVDGVVALTHGTGCGMDTEGLGMRILERTLAGYATHANFAAVIVVGLGCEANQINAWLAHSSLREGETLQVFNIQDAGGTRRTVEKGIGLVKDMLPRANRVKREPCSASHITIGLQCGGSDGYSGISANPALGAAVDLLVAHGGTAILSETPEIYGAEHLLTRRAVRREVGEKLIARIHWWEHYTKVNEGEMNNNPSPGNKAGGLTTILEKSLGAVAKGGTSNLQAVYEYAEPVTAHGFVYMDTPGYDPVSATGQVAGGANMICFTTGRGSAYGCAPSPSLKLATNSTLWQRQEEDMDINCGEIIDGTSSVAEMGERIFRLVLATASGEHSKSEQHGYGQNEFVPWQVGAVM
ncbi:MAG: UxaA family hydrolase, partial [Burkholderiales bacterium]